MIVAEWMRIGANDAYLRDFVVVDFNMMKKEVRKLPMSIFLKGEFA